MRGIHIFLEAKIPTTGKLDPNLTRKETKGKIQKTLVINTEALNHTTLTPFPKKYEEVVDAPTNINSEQNQTLWQLPKARNPEYGTKSSSISNNTDIKKCKTKTEWSKDTTFSLPL